ncbi:hypothetical protein F2Q70_00004959 [Brassica cretica]|uniref:Uncharacterized protein n=2 Tax=Brassica cretica TaxID=69181 RepID=A0A8S9J2J0_BRACR|nr:hypothetical protein F2Q70_00004959 [Brassica cretica]
MSARRGDGKRKRGTNKETEKKNGNVGNKKWRVTKPQQDKETDEYLKEKRNLEYLWKAAFPVGTDALCGLNWDFKHLEEALEEGGFSPREESATEEGTITMRTGWVPYIPLEERDRQVEKTSSRIFTLFCNNRRAALRNKKEERVEKIEYCLAYFSESEEDDTEESSTEVYIMFPSDPPVTCLRSLLTQFSNLKGCLRNKKTSSKSLSKSVLE